MNYDNYFISALNSLKEEGRYRVFNDIKRTLGKFPNAIHYSNSEEREVSVWCSNDYLGMGQNKKLTSFNHLLSKKLI